MVFTINNQITQDTFFKKIIETYPTSISCEQQDQKLMIKGKGILVMELEYLGDKLVLTVLDPKFPIKEVEDFTGFLQELTSKAF